jgi:hypothetical protein
VVDADRNDIQRFTADGKYLATVAGGGSDGDRGHATGVLVDEGGTLRDIDHVNGRSILDAGWRSSPTLGTVRRACRNRGC